MLRAGWFMSCFLATLLAVFFCGDSLSGQAPKQDPKKTPDGKKTDPKKTDPKKPAEPKEQPKPAPPAPPPVAPGPSEFDGPSIDTSKPTSPLDLVRGLREADACDLALEYISVLQNRSLAPDVKLVLPLEAALTRLELAKNEQEVSKREGLIDQAKAEFDRFQKANPSHPRMIEAVTARARATSFQARGQLNRALKLPKAGDKDKAEAVRVRPIFEDAAKQFKSAADKLNSVVNETTATGATRNRLLRELNQAQLDAGINLYELSRTFVRPSGAKEVSARSDSLKAAKEAFKVVGDRDPNNPYSWIAKAWSIECDYSLQLVADADKLAATLRADANRYPAAKEGVRMLRFFEVSHKYTDANAPAELTAARLLGERWLADYRTARGSREEYAVMYYVATLRKEEAIKTGVRTSKNGDTVKIESVSSGAITALRQVDRELRKLIETDNDYSDRAAQDRTQVIRFIIGDKLKPAADYQSFEEAQMAALVEMSTALRDEKMAPKDRAGKMVSAAGYLKRAISLAGPQESAKDVFDARLQMTYALLQGGQPQQAAVLGEYLARNSRTPAEAARAGAMAVQAYLSSGTVADDDLKASAIAVDRSRAVSLATSLEKQFPGEASTDSIRSMMGSELYRSGQYQEAFLVLSRISSQYPGLTKARLMEGASAYQLLRNDQKAKLTPQEKQKVFDSATKNLAALPEPPASASMADARSFLYARQQLIELYLLDPTKSLPKAMTTAKELEKLPGKFTSLPPIAQKTHAFQAEQLRLQTVATMATPLFNTADWKGFHNLLDPLLVDLAKTVAQQGTAAAVAEKSKSEDEPELSNELTMAADRLDQFRRDKIVLLALQAKIRSGDADKTGDLIALMEKLGGSIDANAATLGQLLATVKPQAAALRKQQKNDEADRITGAVGDLFIKFAAKPNLSVKYKYFAGKALNDLGQANKSIELLASLPEAPANDLKAKFNDLSDDQKNAVRTHRSAKLELAKAYRQTGQFDEAEKILAAALGDDKAPGWAARVLDYRKEAIMLIEARAQKATGKDMPELWAKANQAWNKVSREYGAVLSQPLPKEEEKRNETIRNRDQIKPIYYGLFAENQRCLVLANSMILKDKPEQLSKRFDSIVTAMRTIENQNKDLAIEVREQFADLLDATPLLKDKYKAAGGVMFLRDANGQLPSTDA